MDEEIAAWEQILSEQGLPGELPPAKIPCTLINQIENPQDWWTPIVRDCISETQIEQIQELTMDMDEVDAICDHIRTCCPACEGQPITIAGKVVKTICGEKLITSPILAGALLARQ